MSRWDGGVLVGSAVMGGVGSRVTTLVCGMGSLVVHPVTNKSIMQAEDTAKTHRDPVKYVE